MNNTSIVTRSQQATPVREYVGHAWVNTFKQKDGTETKFVNLKFDRGVTALSISDNTRLELWPNNRKREGKQDADFNVRIVQFAA